MKQTNVMSAQEYAQGKELVKRLCKLYHGSFVPDAPISPKQGLAACQTGENEVLPKRAWVLLKRARKGGLLDENWQPQVSRRRAALQAKIISEDVYGANRWKPFEELWGKKSMQQIYQSAQYLNTFESDNKAYCALLGIKERF